MVSGDAFDQKTRLLLMSYENGQLVYITHQKGGAKGIYYRGELYDLAIDMLAARENECGIRLTAILKSNIKDVRTLSESEATQMEIAVREALKSGKEKANLSVPFYFVRLE
jgi:hypothetical protein